MTTIIPSKLATNYDVSLYCNGLALDDDGKVFIIPGRTCMQKVAREVSEAGYAIWHSNPNYTVFFNEYYKHEFTIYTK